MTTARTSWVVVLSSLAVIGCGAQPAADAGRPLDAGGGVAGGGVAGGGAAGGGAAGGASDAGRDAGEAVDAGPTDAGADAGRATPDAGSTDGGWVDYGMGPFTCPGFTSTFSLPPPPVSARTEVPLFGSGGIIVQPLRTPTHPAGVSRMSFYEFRGPPTARQTTLSTRPCDTGPGLSRSFGAQTTILFSVDTPASPPTLAPGRTYYFNTVNLLPNGDDSCPPGGANGGICAGAVEFSPASNW
ncbi:MAG: hypothetical protein Q8L14_33520 [Myxococcales bacterium]|nr:hypothetical protein [Myxococcales bacterium]